MRRRSFLGGLAAAAAVPFLARAAPAQGDPAERIAAFVERAREHWQVPGVSVAVVHEGKRLLVEGFGVKNAMTGAKVDGHTAFNTGSCSKAYTACAAAVAVEDRSTGWDVPVQQVVPELRLYDPDITAAVTLRDLLSHRVGLSRTWVGEYGSDLSRAQILVRATQAGRKAGFREQMCYSNLGFVIAAEAIGRAAGVPFERYLDARVLQQLAMKDSTADPRTWVARVNVADPHHKYDDRQVPVPPMASDNLIGPGSVCVSALDAASWLEFQLGQRGIVSPETLREMHTAQITEPERYGLGWGIGTFRGNPFVWHSGQTRGYSCRTRVDPQGGYAAFAAVNAESSAAEAIVGFIGQVLDRSPVRDWIGYFDSLRERWLDKRAGAMEQDRKADPLEQAAVLPLSAFSGTYRHGGFGTLTLRERDNALRMSIEHLSSHDGWLVRYGGLHFAHQWDSFRPDKHQRPVTPNDTRVLFHAEDRRIVAVEWLDAWFGSARFERMKTEG